MARSAAVTTETTPGIALAAAVSTSPSLACANIERTNTA